MDRMSITSEAIRKQPLKTMKTAQQIKSEVAKQVQWWLVQREKKFSELGHETMSVNPFLLPLTAAIHDFKSFEEVARFAVAAHLATGYATGFGKLVDEKILPSVFGTIKLDKSTRKSMSLTHSDFDEIDHLIPGSTNGTWKLLSLKAGKWTIQLTMAVQLNRAFESLINKRNAGSLKPFRFDEIAVGVFYGTKDGLTDKYDILRGINRGANHHVVNLTKDVYVYTGREFWSWLNSGADYTQEAVLAGILEGVANSFARIANFGKMLENFEKKFAKQYDGHITKSSIDWTGILKQING